MLESFQAQIGVGAALMVLGLAFLRGGGPERMGAGACALVFLASLVLPDDSRVPAAQWGLVAVSGGALVVYAALAWKSRRSWPVWASALQALVVMTHLLSLTESRPPLAAFEQVAAVAGYGVVLILALAILQAARAHRALDTA